MKHANSTAIVYSESKGRIDTKWQKRSLIQRFPNVFFHINFSNIPNIDSLPVDIAESASHIN